MEKEHKPIAAILIGEGKTGKTRSLETLPGGTLLFSFDGGWKTLDPQYEQTTKKIHRKKKLKHIYSFREFLASSDHLERDEILVIEKGLIKNPISLNQFVETNSTPFLAFGVDANELWYKKELCIEKGIRHVVIDPLTVFKNVVLEFILAVNLHSVPSLPDWGMAINKILEVFDSIKGAGFDFILICHIQADKDEVTGRIRELPLIYGKGLPKEILVLFDDIFNTLALPGSKGMEYWWATVPEGLLQGVGTRTFDDLPGRIPQDFGKLYGKRLDW